MKKIITLILWIAVFEGVSYLIGTNTQDGVDNWYKSLQHPPGTPPDWVFPVVWATLYALIAGAGWTLWQRRQAPDGMALLALFAGYMALNWSWSFVFFGMHAPLAGLIWIALMNMIALTLIVKACRDARPAALLMIPPTLWTIYAMYLNCGILWLN